MPDKAIKKLVTDVSETELYDFKKKALEARVSLKKYVRLKLGLDKEKPK